MELIKEEGPKAYEYQKINIEYSKIIKNITGMDNYSKFIGGMPITLERKDCYNLFEKDIKGNYRYSVTQKVDGIRLLMFSSFDDIGGRKICFIDRENNFYDIRNKMNESLPKFKGPRFLIDGELVIFKKDKTTTTDISTPLNEIQSYSYMAFDILYGPTRMEYLEDRYIVDTDAAMSGPIGGSRWPYIFRYDILYKLIVPQFFLTKEEKKIYKEDILKLTNYNSILTDTYLTCKWFTVELKNIYSIESFDKISLIYKSYQTKLIDTRTQFYEYLKKEYIKVKLDGLIFTPFDTDYVIGGVWNKFKNVQYKWKPLEEQSIDFNINYDKNKVVLKVLDKNDSLIEFNKLISEEYIVDKFNKVDDGTIGEFIYLNGVFKLKNLRKEKKNPNAKMTALNVFKAIKYPVELDKIKFFIILNEEVDIKKYKQLINTSRLGHYLPLNKLLYCYYSVEKDKLFNKKVLKEIKENLELFTKNYNYEFEIRLGYLNKNYYDTNLSYNLYKKFMEYLGYYNIKYEYAEYYDIFSETDDKRIIRSRYLYLTELNKHVLKETISKTNINNIDIGLRHLFNIDIRFSLSNEEKIIHVPSSIIKNIYIKRRYSFILNGINIDFTEVQKIDDKEILDKKINYKIEIEIINREIKYYEIINILLLLISF